jgi:hypothetical protein
MPAAPPASANTDDEDQNSKERDQVVRPEAPPFHLGLPGFPGLCGDHRDGPFLGRAGDDVNHKNCPRPITGRRATVPTRQAASKAVRADHGPFHGHDAACGKPALKPEVSNRTHHDQPRWGLTQASQPRRRRQRPPEKRRARPSICGSSHCFGLANRASVLKDRAGSSACEGSPTGGEPRAGTTETGNHGSVTHLASTSTTSTLVKTSSLDVSRCPKTKPGRIFSRRPLLVAIDHHE